MELIRIQLLFDENYSIVVRGEKGVFVGIYYKQKQELRETFKIEKGKHIPTYGATEEDLNKMKQLIRLKILTGETNYYKGEEIE